MHVLAAIAARAASLRAAAFILFFIVVVLPALVYAMTPPAFAASSVTYSTLTAEDLTPRPIADSGRMCELTPTGCGDDDLTTQQQRADTLRPSFSPDSELAPAPRQLAPRPQALLVVPSPNGQGGAIMPLRFAPGVVLGGAAAAPVAIAAAPANDNTPTLATLLESLASFLVTVLTGLVVWAAREYASKNAVAKIVADLTADEKHRATLNEITRAGFNLVMGRMGVTPAELAKRIEDQTAKNKVLEFVKDYVVEHAPDAIEHFGLEDVDADGVPDFIQARLPHLPPPDGAAPASSTPKAA